MGGAKFTAVHRLVDRESSLLWNKQAANADVHDANLTSHLSSVAINFVIATLFGFFFSFSFSPLTCYDY